MVTFPTVTRFIWSLFIRSIFILTIFIQKQNLYGHFLYGGFLYPPCSYKNTCGPLPNPIGPKQKTDPA